MGTSAGQEARDTVSYAAYVIFSHIPSGVFNHGSRAQDATDWCSVGLLAASCRSITLRIL